MRYLLTAEEMKYYDENTIQRIGIPGAVLMERAALGAFETLRQMELTKPGMRALILAGCGNNGGDGLALGRLLCEAGMHVEIWILGNTERATDSWRLQKSILEHYSVSFCKKPSHSSYNVIIDALFGVGLSRPVAGAFAEGIALLQSLDGLKVALDLPSGIDSDSGALMGTAFRADVTVTFGFEKRGLYLYPGKEYAGEVFLIDIGISQRAFYGREPEMFCLDEDVQKLLPGREKKGNKGTFGKALLIAGSFQMAGAAILCAKATYGAGAGMVKVLTDPENRVILQEAVPEALLGSLTDEKQVRESLAWCDVICVGPGLGRGEDARRALKIALTESVLPLVLDADALNLLAESRELAEKLKAGAEEGRKIILTPHLGELMRLYNGLQLIFPELVKKQPVSMEELCRTPWAFAEEIARYFSVIVVAKDARTAVCGKNKKICLNLSGNSGMATAGSGDVLAGILTALMCQGMDAYTAACHGVRLHGLAGDLAAALHGEHGMMAGDLVEALRTFRAGED